MSSDTRRPPAVVIEGVGKRYALGAPVERYRTLREAAMVSARQALHRLRHPAPRRRDGGTLWALQDVSLRVERGRAVGVIGRNGSGKSTLLKILSRVTRPTVGRVELRGRVGTLLEVGTGFHNELTGRENVFLSGAILGMSRAEITQRFDAIVEFAEVGRFIDTPVKRYSSGMYLRLAFAVAAHLDPDILLVDEVLAVGDAAFQRKCLGRMRDVTGDGRTVLFVSHDLDTVQRLCTECVLLDRGRVVAYGPTADVVQQYLLSAFDGARSSGAIDLRAHPRTGTGDARFVSARVMDVPGGVGGQPFPEGPLDLHFVIESNAPRTVGSMAVTLESLNGAKLIEAEIQAIGQTLDLSAGLNSVRFRFESLHLNPGTYDVRLWLGYTVNTAYDHVPSAFRCEVVRPPALSAAALPSTPGLIPCRFRLDVES